MRDTRQCSTKTELAAASRARAAEKKRARFARQYHSAEFVWWMKMQPCCSCYGRKEPIEVHHVTTKGARGTWRETVPLCFTCHMACHREGRVSFWVNRGQSPGRAAELAAAYAAEWEATHGA